MIWCLISFAVGVIFGFIVTALMVIGREND